MNKNKMDVYLDASYKPKTKDLNIINFNTSIINTDFNYITIDKFLLLIKATHNFNISDYHTGLLIIEVISDEYINPELYLTIETTKLLNELNLELNIRFNRADEEDNA